MTRRALRTVVVLAGLVLAVTGLVACGTGQEEETQPAPDVSRMTAGDFEQIPLPLDARPIGPRSEVEGVVSRSYAVGSLEEPAAVLDFYRRELPTQGWEQATAVEPAGEQVLRQDWRSSGRRLEITAAGFGTETETQLSLTLRPDPGDSAASSDTGAPTG